MGSRKPTPYGAAVAHGMAKELSAIGLTVVSGLARGIDTAAHTGALVSGRTIAVMGSGLDVPYPPENKLLMERISESGFVVTEFPPGTKPLKENFPRRNRLISGLSLGVLIVEAAADSGALITARHAHAQGREVFSVPGNISSPASTGTNELIRGGAKVVVSAKDILKELAPVLKGFIKSGKKAKIEITEEEKALCDILSGEPVHVDEILRAAGMPPQKALSLLLGLELKGVIRQMEGKRFHLA